jgi:hypothetical protein
MRIERRQRGKLCLFQRSAEPGDIRSDRKLDTDRMLGSVLGIVPFEAFPDFPGTNPDDGILDALGHRGTTENILRNGALSKAGFVLRHGAIHYVTQKSATPPGRQKGLALEDRIQVLTDLAVGNSVVRQRWLHRGDSSGDVAGRG